MTSNSQKKRPTTPKEDYYKILGVSRTATDEEIKQAYRRLALQYHPDKNPDPEATARFQEINKANKVLGNPRSRSAYDLLGSQAADMMDQYDDYPGTYRQMSGCKKVLFALFCCLSGCGCCCCCFFCFCGCCCCNVFCCNRCCNHCCGLCGDPSVSNESEEQQQQSDYIHRQPTNNNRDSTRY